MVVVVVACSNVFPRELKLDKEILDSEGNRINIQTGMLQSFSHDIRIDHECEDWIERSVPRITDWHHEACCVMQNGDPEDVHVYCLD